MLPASSGSATQMLRPTRSATGRSSNAAPAALMEQIVQPASKRTTPSGSASMTADSVSRPSRAAAGSLTTTPSRRAGPGAGAGGLYLLEHGTAPPRARVGRASPQGGRGQPSD